MEKDITFTEILQSEFYYIIEAIEHGFSDQSVIDNQKAELLEKTSYRYIG